MTKKFDFYKASFALPKDVKDKWVAALRSGEYAQCEGRMSREVMLDGYQTTGYCCLGVLEKITIGQVISDGTPSAESANAIGIVFAFKDATEPDGTNNYGEVCGSHFSVSRQGEEVMLTNLNDNGTSFSEIADLIEENVETYERT